MGFKNLMSSWGSGSKFSNLQQVGDFSIFESKSSFSGGMGGLKFQKAISI